MLEKGSRGSRESKMIEGRASQERYKYEHCENVNTPPSLPSKVINTKEKSRSPWNSRRLQR